jgi:prepilin-type N-terminal cleavage/methylation domain-containing protein
MNITLSRKPGFTLVEMAIVVSLIVLLAVIAVPSYVRARTSAQSNACINNLSQLDAAKQAWSAAMHVDPSTVPASTDIQPFLGRGSTGTLPVCPCDTNKAFATSYTLHAINALPTCQILGTATNYPHVLH